MARMHQKNHHNLLTHTRDKGRKDCSLRGLCWVPVSEAGPATVTPLPASLAQALGAPWAGLGGLHLGREMEAFAVCGCLLCLETQASQSHK